MGKAGESKGFLFRKSQMWAKLGKMCQPMTLMGKMGATVDKRAASQPAVSLTHQTWAGMKPLQIEGTVSRDPPHPRSLRHDHGLLLAPWGATSERSRLQKKCSGPTFPELSSTRRARWPGLIVCRRMLRYWTSGGPVDNRVCSSQW